MTSLNNFKMDGRNVDEPVIGGAPNLDMMLGDLQEDMDKQVSVSGDSSSSPPTML